MKLNRRRTARLPGEPLGSRLGRGLGALGRALVSAGRPALRVGAAIAIAAVATGAGLAVHRELKRSPRFAITEIRLPTVERLSYPELARTLGVKVGDNLLGVDLHAIEAQLTALPWVKTARVRRELPCTLAVEIVERKPVGLVSIGGPLYLVERDGVPFKRAGVLETEGLPVITGIARDRYRAVPEAAHALIREALEVAQAYSAEKTRPPLGEIHADPRYGFELETAPARSAAATRIFLGRGEIPGKLRRLDLVLGRIGADAAATIRLDNATRPDRVAVKLAKL